jgi:hypothetical protein
VGSGVGNFVGEELGDADGSGVAGMISITGAAVGSKVGAITFSTVTISGGGERSVANTELKTTAIAMPTTLATVKVETPTGPGFIPFEMTCTVLSDA